MNELKRRFPFASPAFLKANIDADSGRVCAVQSKSVERLPLEPDSQGEETCWYGAAERFEIVFTVYAVRPCDWDGYDIKSLQDFLVTAGMLPGDGWKTLSGRVITCKAATKAEEKTVIEIRGI